MDAPVIANEGCYTPMGVDFGSGSDRCFVTFRFPRKEFFSPTPARREWEAANGRRLQAIDRQVDIEHDEIVCVYRVMGAP
jgi:hypothetical protein